MALVRVRWEVTEVHEAEIEIDGFDPDDGVDGGVLAENEGNDSYEFTSDRNVLESEVVREGEPVEVDTKIKAPQHAPDWDDD